MEDADCGAACLSIILTRHGRRAPLAELRELCGAGRNGTTAVGFGRAAATFGLEVKGRNVVPSDVDSVARLPVPSVVLLDGRHYAVLEGVRGNRVWINDPAVGRIRLTAEEFAARSSGIVLVATRTPDFRPGGPRLPFVRAVFAKVRPYLPIVAVAALLGVLAAVPTVLAALTMRALLNRVLVIGDHAWRPALLAVLVVGAVLAGVTGWAQQRVLSRALSVMATRFSSTYLAALLRLPGEFFHRRHLSGLVKRAQMNDGLAIMLSDRLAVPVTASVTILGYAFLLSVLAPALLAVMAVAATAQLLLLRAVVRVAGPHQQRLLFEQVRRDATAHSGLSMIEAIKADGAEQWLFGSWVRSATRALRTGNALGSATLSLLAVSSAVAPAALAAFVVVGAHQVASGELALGTLLTAQLVAGGLLSPLGVLVGLGSEVQITRVQMSITDDALQAVPHPARAHVLDRAAAPPAETPSAPKRLTGAIEFDDVTFGYDRYGKPLLRNLSFAAEPGEWVALVGATGSGKSTIARLAVGAVDPWKGTIRLDGRPRDTYTRERLAASIGYVEQTLRLFEGSLRDNLTLWDDTVPEERLRAALRDADLDRLVDQRGGLDGGQVTEHARNLSGGEQQRMELARALAGDPPLLVLDEATSALDSSTEHVVLDALRRRGVTCLFIAHRISTVRDADLILVLDKGRVAQRGRHEELIAAPGLYRRLATGGAA
ncbi:ATP-binding cassette domain-containing protein [Phytohabitans sp. ZYX-F-186]|uniref:ATP-binding cassette domain-containing protein n=1 Tax=Phytohabitans maris TaxID=3071409 RepID=A0ABU0ZAS2_9ACTN|nr:ATP-binding cassette domain-containing protein [Phytohabitans sp. ZYX-F-186]MDQ7904155.1 ATP-binding cassette domain-containing protein [Phytohabitans sp. ZYX-F-186]